jgi:hypothetical protein
MIEERTAVLLIVGAAVAAVAALPGVDGEDHALDLVAPGRELVFERMDDVARVERMQVDL